MQRRSLRLLASVGLAAVLAVTAAGCASTSNSTDVTGSIASNPTPHTDAEWRQEMEAAGSRYRADAHDPQAAIRYAQALRAIGQRAQAAAVLEQSAIANPGNR